MATRPALPLAPLPLLRTAGRFADAAPVGFHAHEASELVLVTEGSCRITVGEAEPLAGAAGALFVLPARTPHDQRNDGFCRTTYLTFDAAALAFADRARVVALAADDPALGWIEDCCRLWRAQPTPAGDGPLAGLLHAIFERVKAIEARDAGARALPRAVVEAARWLERNLIDAVTVNDLARLVELSPSHLTALFRAHLGCPPLKYQQRLRLALARKLLRDSYLRVSEVAAACGYADPNYFIRVFRAQVGRTPQAWRRGAG